MSRTDRADLPWLERVPRPAGAPDPLAIEIDSAAIGTAGWVPLDLATLGNVLAGTSGVRARFGQVAVPAGNDNGALAVVAPFPLVAHNDSEPLADRPRAVRRPLTRLYRKVATPGEDGADMTPAETCDDLPASGEGPLAETVTVMPLPANRPIGWQPAVSQPRGRYTQGLDRSSVNALIFLMILGWMGAVGFGLYKATTPGSGAAIKWRD